MAFSHVQHSLATCQAHLAGIPISDLTKPEVESRLVAGLVLLIVSEYEVLIQDLFNQRVAACGDAHVCSYFAKATKRAFVSPKLEKIIGLLGMFGPDYKDRFSSTVLQTPEHAAWDNIIRERHAVVHKAHNRQMTLPELMNTYPETSKIIDALKHTLGLR